MNTRKRRLAKARRKRARVIRENIELLAHEIRIGIGVSLLPGYGAYLALKRDRGVGIPDATGGPGQGGQND